MAMRGTISMEIFMFILYWSGTYLIGDNKTINKYFYKNLTYITCHYSDNTKIDNFFSIFSDI